MFRKAIIVGPAYPLRGGIANFNESLCAEMVKEGLDSSIVSFSMQYPSMLFPGTSQFEKSSPGEIVRGLKIYPMINSVNPISWFRTARFIADQKPDILLVRYWLPFFAPALGIIIRRVKKMSRNTKVVGITDNILPHEKRIGDKALTRYFVKACDGFVVMSGTVRDELRAFVKEPRFSLIHHPVYDIFGDTVSKQAARDTLKLDQSGRYILFFGFVRKYKGLDLLIEAMRDDQIKNLGIKLIVAGEFYENKQKYLAAIESYEIQDRVILFDQYIPSEEVCNYFAAADLVTQPYRTASQSGITQLAYHFERPVLVTNVGGLSEVIENDNSGYVTTMAPKDIADKIVDFYINQREEGMVSSIKKHKQKFSWSAMVSGIQSLYGSI